MSELEGSKLEGDAQRLNLKVMLVVNMTGTKLEGDSDINS